MKQPAPRRRPRQQRSTETVNALLTATERLVADRGLAKTTMTAIVRKSGVSAGSLYQYFPNKEALLGALCERYMLDDYAMFCRTLDAHADQSWDDFVAAVTEA